MSRGSAAFDPEDVMLADSVWVSLLSGAIGGIVALIGVGLGAWLTARSTRAERRETMWVTASGELLVSAAQFAATLDRLRKLNDVRDKKFDDTKHYFGEEIARVRVAIEKVRLLAPKAASGVAAEMSDMIDKQIGPLHIRLDTDEPLTPVELQGWDSLCRDFRPLISKLRDASRSSLSH